MNQREWKPADHRLGVERAGTVIVVAAGGLLVAGALFLLFALMPYLIG
uniref:Uncharacterized protein n=1 Tax=Streptomyces sp. NBC_00049 TaxID=2903617 RepID=A0AAU2JV25_9ACTN